MAGDGDCIEPCIQMCVIDSQEEAETRAWMEHKMTEALDQLEIMSLKELIIWKAWAGWEEGLRLSHKQWEIGEAAAKMQTTSDQLILMLKLTRSERK